MSRHQICVARVSGLGGNTLAESACWLNAGDDTDVENAKAWAAREGWTVHVYPATQGDPLNKAKADALAVHWAALPTYVQYLAARAKGLKENYPDSTREERGEILKAAGTEWLRMLASLPRTAVVPLRVGRSLVALIGHAEAGRTLRHVSNYPACLPARAADGASRGR